MRKQHLVLFVILMLVTACNSSNTQQAPEAPLVELDAPATLAISEPMQEALPPVETAAPNCLGDETSPIGQSIADEYETANYDQVMTWFCNGAEFEDILVALETETQIDTSANEMIQMLADGFTWEEIWLVTGFVD